jgi:hypothetical protein
VRIRDAPVRGRGSAIVINAAWVPARVLVIAIVDGFIVFNATARTAVAHNEEYAHSQKDVDRVGIHESVKKFHHLVLQKCCSVKYDLYVYSNPQTSWRKPTNRAT